MTRITKDSGERELNAGTGMVRDTEIGKPCFSHMPNTIIECIEHFGEGSFHPIANKEFVNTSPDINVAIDVVPKYDLVHPLMLNRLQSLMIRGAEKYGRHNWQKGTDLSRSFNSLIRHAIQWWLGDTSEDHLSAVIFNAMALLVTEDNINNGKLPIEFADCGDLNHIRKRQMKVDIEKK